jgi:ADP-ribose pyrophosphatase YjhB (NUDIX family)
MPPLRQVYRVYDPQQHPPADSFRYCPRCRADLTCRQVETRQRAVCPQCGFIHYQNPAPAVSVLITQGDRVLLGIRAGEPGKGKWATPSGYIEFEDDFLSTALREAREETGLEIEIKAILNVASSFLSPKYHFFAVYLLAEAVGGTLTPGDDMLEVGWFSPAGPLPELAFEEDAEILLRYAQGSLARLPVTTPENE